MLIQSQEKTVRETISGKAPEDTGKYMQRRVPVKKKKEKKTFLFQGPKILSQLSMGLGDTRWKSKKQVRCWGSELEKEPVEGVEQVPTQGAQWGDGDSDYWYLTDILGTRSGGK